VLWLVRHSETTWNSIGWVQGQIDGARLTRKGRQQARHVADLLAEESVGAIYSSDLYRARRTAAVMADRFGLDISTDRRLRERCFGMAEGVPSTNVPPYFTGIHNGHVVDESARAPGGESLHDVYLRCSTFLRDLTERTHESDVAVVAHGGSIRMLRALVAEQDVHGLAWGPVPNASICRLELPPSSMASSSPRSLPRSG
jgi:broad specificity phosphatase PhoE